MKSFNQWLSEDAPTNCISGSIRGLGNVTGDPNGVTNYAVANQADAIASGDQVNDILKMHQEYHASAVNRVSQNYK